MAGVQELVQTMPNSIRMAGDERTRCPLHRAEEEGNKDGHEPVCGFVQENHRLMTTETKSSPSDGTDVLLEWVQCLDEDGRSPPLGSFEVGARESRVPFVATNRGYPWR